MKFTTEFQRKSVERRIDTMQNIPIMWLSKFMLRPLLVMMLDSSKSISCASRTIRIPLEQSYSAGKVFTKKSVLQKRLVRSALIKSTLLSRLTAICALLPGPSYERLYREKSPRPSEKTVITLRRSSAFDTRKLLNSFCACLVSSRSVILLNFIYF